MATATARQAAPAPRAPSRRAPARRVPARQPAPSRRPGGQLIPLAVGTASAVRRLPDSGPIVRLTRGRAWIAVLGMLLAGIVALNVITLSFAAQAGQVAQSIQALDADNSVVRSRDARLSGAARVRHEATALGLGAATVDPVGGVRASKRDVALAAQRLAAAGTAY